MHARQSKKLTKADGTIAPIRKSPLAISQGEAIRFARHPFPLQFVTLPYHRIHAATHNVVSKNETYRLGPLRLEAALKYEPSRPRKTLHLVYDSNTTLQEEGITSTELPS